MSSFLDKKERVLDVQLTEYGKHLLSKGEFNPEYYAFFDDDVIYDIEYAGITETQNSASARIKEQPQLSTPSLFHGGETEIVKVNSFIRLGETYEDGRQKNANSPMVQPTAEKQYAISAPLGTMTLEDQTRPAWAINVLQGEISGTSAAKSGNHPTMSIPQLDLEDIVYEIRVKQGELPGQEDDQSTFFEGDPREPGQEADLNLLIRKFSDGTYIEVKDDFLLLEVGELFTELRKDQFDIEVYEITTDAPVSGSGADREVLIPLYFQNKQTQIKDGLYVGDQQNGNEKAEIDASFVEYFFDLRVDDEIDERILCAHKPINPIGNTFGNRDLNCKDITAKKPKQLYQTNVTIEDIDEPC